MTDYNVETIKPTTVHELKTIKVFFDMVLKGVKPYEIRKNDRNYKQNDIVVLKEVENENRNNYTGRHIKAVITNVLSHEILQSHGINAIEEGTVILTLSIFAFN